MLTDKDKQFVLAIAALLAVALGLESPIRLCGFIVLLVWLLAYQVFGRLGK